MMSLGQLMGTTVHHTTAYKQKANDTVEQFHRTFKVAIMSQCSNSTWFSQLPWILLGLHITLKKGLDLSLAGWSLATSLLYLLNSSLMLL